MTSYSKGLEFSSTPLKNVRHHIIVIFKTNDTVTVTTSHLYDARFVENTLAHWLEPFHVLQYLSHPNILSVNNTESGHVHKVVLEVF
jgi:hypothetical protein